jgi:radical SAM protein with 4Fe4S-binding SPASM domain
MNGNSHRLEFAKLLLAAGHPSAAEAALRVVLDGVPDDGEALRLLGTLRLDQGETDAAATVLKCAVTVDPTSADALYGLGMAAWRRQNMGEALRCGQRVRRLGADPAAIEFFLQMSRDAYNQALTQHAEGGHAGAVALLRLLIEDPDEEVRARASAKLYCIAREALAEKRPAEMVAFAPMLPDGHIVTSAFRVRIEASSACNLRCRHCPTGVSYTGTERRLMKAEVFERVIESLQQLRELSSCVMYLGGEPLLHPQLAALCRRVVDETSVTQLHFNTNAMLLTEEKCRELAGSGVTRICVSIDGRSPEENDRLRRGASYETVRENVRMLLRHTRPAGISVEIANVVVRRPGDPDVPTTPDFLRRDLPDVPIESVYAMRWPGWDTPEDEPSLEITTDSKRHSGFCLLPFSDMVVRANGDVTLCCYDILGAEVMGRITETSLAEIWNGPKYRALRLAMAEGRTEDIPDVCQRCPIYTGEVLITRTWS